MFGTNHVSYCLYVLVRCCARQKYSEFIARRRVLNKIGAVILKDCENSKLFTSFTTMRDYSNGTGKNGSIQEQNADHNISNISNGR